VLARAEPVTRKPQGRQPPALSPPIPLGVLEQAAEILKAVAHPVRLRIVDLLGHNGEMNVGQLVETLEAKPAITSQQLGLMKDRGIVACRRDGNKVYYRLANPNLMRMLDCIRDHCSKSDSRTAGGIGQLVEGRETNGA
jgi:DNA-binding transcriptional ArsR family regulator